MADEKIVIKVDGDTKGVDKALKGTQTQLKKTEKQTDDLTEAFGAVKIVAVAAFAAIAGATAISIKKFAEFDNELRGVKTLLDQNAFGAKGLEKGFEGMRKEMLAVASRVPVSIGAMNKALFDTVSAGVEASKAVGFVEVSAKLAVAGLTDVATATDGMTSALNAYGLDASEAEVVASKFFAAQKAGKTTIAELSNGFGVVGASAAAFGVSLDEVLSAVSAVTTAGVKTGAAYTGLKAVFANIAKPTADAAKEAKRLNIEFTSMALRELGLKGFFDAITKSSGFTTRSIEKLFGSVEAQNIAFALAGGQARNFAENIKTLGNEQKTLNTLTGAYGTQAGSTKNQLTVLANRMDSLAINLGEKLAPALITVVDGFTRLFNLDDRNKIIKVDRDVENVKKGIARLTEELEKGADRDLISLFFDPRSPIEMRRQLKLLEQDLIDVKQAKKDLKFKEDDFEFGAEDPEEKPAGLGAFTSEEESLLKAGLEREKEIKLANAIATNEELLKLQEEAAIAKEELRLAALDEEQMASEFDKEILESKLNEEQQIRAQAQMNVQEGQLNHLKTMAKIQLDSDKTHLKNQRVASKQLVALENQKNQAILNGTVQLGGALIAASGANAKTQFALQKALAIASATVAAYMASNLALATPPGPPYTIPVAAAALTNGLINVGFIAATGMVQLAGMQEGGFVTGGVPGRDSVPTMLEPGEFVVPRENAQEAAARLGGEGDTGPVEVVLTMRDNLVDFIEAELAERQALDTGV